MLNLGCDQVSKEVVRNQVAHRDYIQLIDHYFILTNVENTGAMLGFGQNFTPLLKIIFLQGLPLIVLLVLFYRLMTRAYLNRWLVIAFAFVVGGGLGNLIDRIVHGSVTDFFQVQVGFFKTGIFNMADVAVTFGVLLILGLSLFHKKLAL